MRKYDSYKKSTFEWMVEIPSHWILTKNRFGFQKCSNGINESDDTPVLSLTTKGVKVKTNLSFGKSTESYIGHQLVEKGDIVFTPRDFDQTPILSDVSNYFGCISNLYIVDKTKEGVLNHFVNYYWYGLKYSVDYFKNFSHGMRYSFNRFQFDEIPLILPPLSEQTQIVSYLDRKTEGIDKLIQTKVRKIELLKEYRTSIISKVVTKGLNPNVEMKESGVEWIGEIPSHWDKLPLKHFGQVTLGKMLTSEDKGGNHLKPYLRSQNIQTERVNTTDVKEMWFSDSEIEKLKLETGDLLFNEGGDVGRTCIWMNEIDECYFQNSVNRVRFETDKERYFLHLSILYHSVGYYDSLVNRVSIPHLTKEKLESVIFIRPPISEQTQIVSYLDEQTQLIDKNIQTEERKIELLKEFRQSLISEVVTGKIKVCNDEEVH